MQTGGHDIGECAALTGYPCALCAQLIRAARLEAAEREQAARIASLERVDTSPQDDRETT